MIIIVAEAELFCVVSVRWIAGCSPSTLLRYNFIIMKGTFPHYISKPLTADNYYYNLMYTLLYGLANLYSTGKYILEDGLQPGRS